MVNTHTHTHTHWMIVDGILMVVLMVMGFHDDLMGSGIYDDSMVI